MTTIITQQERDSIVARDKALMEWLRRTGKTSRSGYASYKPGEPESAGITPPTNEERSAVEMFDWIHSPPERYMAFRTNTTSVHNWMGAHLASITWQGHEFRDNLGGRRYCFRCVGTNGVKYSGTAYPSSGDYVRLRRIKRLK